MFSIQKFDFTNSKVEFQSAECFLTMLERIMAVSSLFLLLPFKKYKDGFFIMFSVHEYNLNGSNLHV